MIRIIGGKYKGKRLKRVPNFCVRPMPDKLKESLFSIIQTQVKESVFLDGFAGTGSIGLEAISRGAQHVTFVDEYAGAVKIIKHNAEKCDALEKVRIIHKEFNRAVIQFSKEKKAFSLIFLDPPYKLLDERNPLKVINKRGILEKGGLIILRHHFKTRFDAVYFRLKRRITIGDDSLSFYE